MNSLWKNQLLVTSTGAPRPLLANAITALREFASLVVCAGIWGKRSSERPHLGIPGSGFGIDAPGRLTMTCWLRNGFSARGSRLIQWSRLFNAASTIQGKRFVQSYPPRVISRTRSPLRSTGTVVPVVG